jgi:Yip1 domain
MATAVPPIPQETARGLSEPERIINTYIAPSKTFEDIRRNASWWVPWLLLSVCSVLFGVIKFQKLDPRHLVQQRIEQSERSQRQMEQLSPEQRESSIAIQAKVARIIFFLGPIGYILASVVLAAILMAVFNFGFAAEIPFQRYLAITFYSFLPVVLSTLLTAITVILNPDNYNQFNAIATNPAYFMDRADHKFLWGIAAGFDIFAIWIVVLLASGIAANSTRGRLKRGTAFTTMFVLYGLLVLGGAAIGSIF